jgi:cytochrome o ubiquinol oxidase subunit 1
VLHNSLFLIAHFHNMLIPGSLFGFFAGYAYWFPKAVGFRLNEKWGKWAFWCWLIGFYLAFTPSVRAGFHGHAPPHGALCQPGLATLSDHRRRRHRRDPDRHLFTDGSTGGEHQATSRATRDLTGDPWDGRTLEWATSSPRRLQFRENPVVHDIDAFADMKEKDIAYRPPDRYHDIHMPKNTGKGFVIGVLAFVFGFAMVWYIWWLAVLSALGMIFTVIVRASDDDTEFVLPAAEVERIENRRFRQLTTAATNLPAGGQTPLHPLPAV